MGITTGADRRLTGHNVFSASNKGHAQVAHVEARVGFEVEPIHSPLTCLQDLVSQIRVMQEKGTYRKE